MNEYIVASPKLIVASPKLIAALPKLTAALPRLKLLSCSLLAATAVACGGGTQSTSSSTPGVGGGNSSSLNQSSNQSSSTPIAQSSSSTVSSVTAPSSTSSAASSGSAIPNPTPKPNGSPTADVSGTWPIVGLAPMRVVFMSRASYDDKGIVSVQWDFGDGTISTEANPSHAYSAAGTYQATLTVTDTDGMTDTDAVNITLLNQVGGALPPLANIAVSTLRGESPLPVTLDGSGSTAMGSIVSYEWDFGNGKFAYGPVVDYVLQDPFEYEVFLTVTDDRGLSHSTSISITATLTVPKGAPGTPMQTDGNPFADSAFYISPDIETLQDQSLERIDPVTQKQLYDDIKFVQQIPSAVWLDQLKAIYGGEENGGRRSLASHLDEAVAQQQALAVDGVLPPMTAVIIIYNMPDRDCAALASNGLLHEATDGDGDGQPDRTGMQIYQEDYIDVIAATFAQYPTLRIVTLLEPDGFANMVTNTGATPECAAVFQNDVYKLALQYAMRKFMDLDNVYAYLDIGHSGWLGWADNLAAAITRFTDLVAGVDGGRLDVIKGFASNTSGYTPLREPFISNAFADRQSLASFYEWNQQVDELSFVDTLYDRFRAAGFPEDLGFMIDTARNGWGGPNRPTGEGAPAARNDPDYRIDLRRHRGHWCNVAEAGIGEIPQADPDPARPYIDAYYWIKPPGESDGISDPNAVGVNEEGKSYDPMCGGEATNTTRIAANVLMGAPHAGSWFHDQFIVLIENAYPPLGVKVPDQSGGVAYIDDFNSYAAGAGPAGQWTVETEGTATASVSTERFFGLSGNSVKITAPEETPSSNSLAMLTLDSDGLGTAGSNMFGRMHVFVEDNGAEDDIRWTLIEANGAYAERQLSYLAYRFGGSDGLFATSLDTNARGAQCNLPSALSIPREQWSCVEWQLDAASNTMRFWIDGELISDLDINQDSPGCSTGDWTGPDSWSELKIGVGRYRPAGQQPQNQPVTPPKPDVSLFVDNFALSTSRLGCGTVRP